MQKAKEENNLKLKKINCDLEEKLFEATKPAVRRSNSLSKELIQRRRGRPKKEQRPRTGSIDAYLSPRTKKRKLKESPKEENKKEIKKKCSTEMANTGIKTNALLTQLLEKSRKEREEQGEIKKTIMDKSRKRREEQEEIKKAIMGLTNKFENIEMQTKQNEEKLEAEERNARMMKKKMEKNKFDLESTKKRIDNIEQKIE